MSQKFSDGTYFKDVPMFSFDEDGNIEEHSADSEKSEQ